MVPALPLSYGVLLPGCAGTRKAARQGGFCTVITRPPPTLGGPCRGVRFHGQLPSSTHVAEFMSRGRYCSDAGSPRTVQIGRCWEQIWQFLLNRVGSYSGKCVDLGLMVLAALLEAGWIDTIVDMKALRSHEVWKLPCFVHADRCTSATLLFLNAFLHFEAKFEAPAPDSATLEWSQAMLKLVLAMPSSISGRGLYTTAEAQALQTGVPSIELYFLSLLQLHRCTGNVGHIVQSHFARFALLPIRPIDADVQFLRNEILLDNICVRAQLGDRPSMLMETDAEMMAQASTSTLLGTGLLDVSHEFAQCVLKAVDRALLKCQKAQPIGAVTELVGTLECFFVSICATDCLADSDTKHEAATLLPKAFRLLLSAAAQMKSNLDLLQDIIAPISQFLSHLLHLPHIDQSLMAIPGIPHVLSDLAQLCGEIWESHDQLPSGQSSGRAVHRNGSLIRVSQADVELSLPPRPPPPPHTPIPPGSPQHPATHPPGHRSPGGRWARSGTPTARA